MRAWADALLCALVGVVAVICVLFVRISIVGGGSMEPALARGDVCVALKGVSVRPGDVVLFRREGSRPVLHRAVAVDQYGGVRTRGDANRCEDRTPVTAQDVRGRVVVVVPLGRAVRGWMRAARDATLLTRSS